MEAVAVGQMLKRIGPKKVPTVFNEVWKHLKRRTKKKEKEKKEYHMRLRILNLDCHVGPNFVNLSCFTVSSDNNT